MDPLPSNLPALGEDPITHSSWPPYTPNIHGTALDALYAQNRVLAQLLAQMRLEHSSELKAIGEKLDGLVAAVGEVRRVEENTGYVQPPPPVIASAMASTLSLQQLALEERLEGMVSPFEDPVGQGDTAMGSPEMEEVDGRTEGTETPEVVMTEAEVREELEGEKEGTRPRVE